MFFSFTIYIYIYIYSIFGTECSLCTGRPGSIPGRVIPKTLKMVLDTSLLNTQQYKVRIKGKMKQSRERSSTLPYNSVVAIEKRAFGLPSTTVAKFTFIYLSFGILSPETINYVNNYGRHLYFFLTVCIYIYIYMFSHIYKFHVFLLSNK